MLERYVGEIEGLLVCRASLVVPKKLAHIGVGGDAENHCTSCMYHPCTTHTCGSANSLNCVVKVGT